MMPSVIARIRAKFGCFKGTRPIFEGQIVRKRIVRTIRFGPPVLPRAGCDLEWLRVACAAAWTTRLPPYY